jgi:hypothetical protein
MIIQLKLERITNRILQASNSKDRVRDSRDLDKKRQKKIGKNSKLLTIKKRKNKTKI